MGNEAKMEMMGMGKREREREGDARAEMLMLMKTFLEQEGAEKAARAVQKHLVKIRKGGKEGNKERGDVFLFATACRAAIKRQREEMQDNQKEDRSKVNTNPKEVHQSTKEKKRSKRKENDTNIDTTRQSPKLPKKSKGNRAISASDEEINGAQSDIQSQKSIAEVRSSMNMTVTIVGRGETKIGSADIAPILSFSSCGADSRLLEIACKDYAAPTPIQSQCIPFLCSGVDLVGIAATGSGKTMAYVLPALTNMIQSVSNSESSNSNNSRGNHGCGRPYCLVLAPTRELAQQINVEVNRCVGNKDNERKIVNGSRSGLDWIRSEVIYGGVAKLPQARALRALDSGIGNMKVGVGVIVATPGRLLDHVQDGVVQLADVQVLVLDEADRMLDLGFEKDIRNIIAQTSCISRQTVMFSATWPDSVKKIADEFLGNNPKKPYHVHVTIGSEQLAANHAVKQIVEVMKPDERDNRLLKLLRENFQKTAQSVTASPQNTPSSSVSRILIFVLYKKEAPRLESLLARNKYHCVGITGDKSQEQRNMAVEQFKRGDVPLLIATDVAARGLDIDGIDIVINYSFPLTSEDYVHRIGRTGRAGKTGKAITFFTVNDKQRAGELVNVLREAKQEVPPDLLKFGTTVKRKEHSMYGHVGNGGGIGNNSMPNKPTKITFDYIQKELTQECVMSSGLEFSPEESK